MNCFWSTSISQRSTSEFDQHDGFTTLVDGILTARVNVIRGESTESTESTESRVYRRPSGGPGSAASTSRNEAKGEYPATGCCNTRRKQGCKIERQLNRSCIEDGSTSLTPHLAPYSTTHEDLHPRPVKTSNLRPLKPQTVKTRHPRSSPQPLVSPTHTQHITFRAQLSARQFQALLLHPAQPHRSLSGAYSRRRAQTAAPTWSPPWPG